MVAKAPFGDFRSRMRESNLIGGTVPRNTELLVIRHPGLRSEVQYLSHVSRDCLY